MSRRKPPPGTPASYAVKGCLAMLGAIATFASAAYIPDAGLPASLSWVAAAVGLALLYVAIEMSVRMVRARQARKT